MRSMSKSMAQLMANLLVLARAIRIVLRCRVGWMTWLCMIHRSWGGGSQIWTDPLACDYKKKCFSNPLQQVLSPEVTISYMIGFWMLLVRVNLQSRLCIEHLTLQRGLYWQCSSEQNWWEKNKPCPFVRHLALHHRTPGSVHARLKMWFDTHQFFKLWPFRRM